MLLQGILKEGWSGQVVSAAARPYLKISNQGWLAVSSMVLVWLC